VSGCKKAAWLATITIQVDAVAEGITIVTGGSQMLSTQVKNWTDEQRKTTLSQITLELQSVFAANAARESSPAFGCEVYATLSSDQVAILRDELVELKQLREHKDGAVICGSCKQETSMHSLGERIAANALEILALESTEGETTEDVARRLVSEVSRLRSLLASGASGDDSPDDG
jgi:hypothetical protein